MNFNWNIYHFTIKI